VGTSVREGSPLTKTKRKSKRITQVCSGGVNFRGLAWVVKANADKLALGRHVTVEKRPRIRKQVPRKACLHKSKRYWWGYEQRMQEGRGTRWGEGERRARQQSDYQQGEEQQAAQ